MRWLGLAPVSPIAVPQMVPLSEVCEVRVSNVDKKSEPGELPVRLCNSTDIYKNDYITDDLEFMRATASRAERADRLLSRPITPLGTSPLTGINRDSPRLTRPSEH